MRLRIPGLIPWRKAAPYTLQPPYGEARADFLSRRPGPDDTERADRAVGPFGGIFAVVADVGQDNYLVSVYLFADGTISIYSSVGTHSTGLGGAPSVVETAAVLVEEVQAKLAEFSPVDDLAALPLPDHGCSQILVRTLDGDFAASDRLNSKHEVVAELAAMGLILTHLARAALIEGFDRVEAGQVCYRLDPEYRRVRSTLMSWIPEQVPQAARVVSVVVEIADAEARTVTSLFAFADGSTSVYRSDGTRADGLSGIPGVAGAAGALLHSVESALPAFRPSALLPLPQPGRVQFIVHAKLRDDGVWTELAAIVTRAELEDGSHPLSAAFDRANEVLRLAV
jgi:hypothetical protein